MYSNVVLRQPLGGYIDIRGFSSPALELSNRKINPMKQGNK